MKTTNIPERKADYYNILYKKSAEYKKPWQQSRYLNLWKQVLAWLPEEKFIKILDAGCGSGQLISMLWDEGYKNLKGIDFAPEPILIAGQQRPDIALNKVFSVGNVFTTEVKEFDVIICTEVLEHIEKDLELIKFWAAKQKLVILSVPSFGDPAHVRFFESCEDVKERYGKYFLRCECVKIGAWFVFKGEVK